MIGRVAEFKFRGTELEEIGLDKKIEQILDDIFVVLGKDAKRKLVEVEFEENTQSDSEYWPIISLNNLINYNDYN